MSLFKYLLFGFMLLYTAMWMQASLFLGSLGNDKPPITVIENKEINQLIQEKAGIHIANIKISESDQPFGMMVGIPGNPQLILSRELYDTFTPNEIEYVLLHEAGHYALAHSIKELIAGLILFAIGIVVLKNSKRIFPALAIAGIMGLAFGVMMIRFGAFNEIQADNFAVTKMTHPKGMMTATEKFRNYYLPSSETRNKVLEWMFYRGNPFDNRIKMAQEEIATR